MQPLQLGSIADSIQFSPPRSLALQLGLQAVDPKAKRQQENCFATKDLSKVPLAEDVTFEEPLMPKLTGRQTIKSFLASILPVVKGIQLKQHIVEGNYVAPVFDMETIHGVDHVFDWIQIVDGEIKGIHTFYYPNLSDPPLRRSI